MELGWFVSCFPRFPGLCRGVADCNLLASTGKYGGNCCWGGSGGLRVGGSVLLYAPHNSFREAGMLVKCGHLRLGRPVDFRVISNIMILSFAV